MPVLLLGASADITRQTFLGTVDDLSTYDRALTPTEVLRHYLDSRTTLSPTNLYTNVIDSVVYQDKIINIFNDFVQNVINTGEISDSRVGFNSQVESLLSIQESLVQSLASYFEIIQENPNLIDTVVGDLLGHGFYDGIISDTAILGQTALTRFAGYLQVQETLLSLSTTSVKNTLRASLSTLATFQENFTVSGGYVPGEVFDIIELGPDTPQSGNNSLASVIDSLLIIGSHILGFRAKIEELIQYASRANYHGFAELLETIRLTTLTSNRGNLRSRRESRVFVQDLKRVLFPATLSEHVSFSVSVSSLTDQIVRVLDSLRTTSTFASRGNLSSIITAILAARATALSGKTVYQIDSLSLSDQRNIIVEKILSHYDTVTLSGSLIPKSLYLKTIKEDGLSFEDLLGIQTKYSQTLFGNVTFILGSPQTGFEYEAWVMNPKTYGTSHYSRYNFNSICKFQDEYYLAGEKGLFKMGGTTDDGEYITSIIKTASLDFDTSLLKNVSKTYLGLSHTGKLILRVAVDGVTSAYYELKTTEEKLQTKMFNIGKGLIGRYWQFELQTKESTSFHLDEIEFFPVMFGRKI